jgi:hypothetical protein
MNKYKIIIAILVVLLIVILGLKYTKDNARENFKQFYSANLNSEIEYWEIASKGIRFKLKDNKMKYVFYPKVDRIGRIFEHVANKGDIIMKTPSSDTLKLIKENEILSFTFEKFD